VQIVDAVSSCARTEDPLARLCVLSDKGLASLDQMPVRPCSRPKPVPGATPVDEDDEMCSLGGGASVSPTGPTSGASPRHSVSPGRLPSSESDESSADEMETDQEQMKHMLRALSPVDRSRSRTEVGARPPTPLSTPLPAAASSAASSAASPRASPAHEVGSARGSPYPCLNAASERTPSPSQHRPGPSPRSVAGSSPALIGSPLCSPLRSPIGADAGGSPPAGPNLPNGSSGEGPARSPSESVSPRAGGGDTPLQEPPPPAGSPPPSSPAAPAEAEPATPEVAETGEQVAQTEADAMVVDD